MRGGALKRHVPETVGFEVDYAEFLEEALVEAWELRGSLEGNVARGGEREREGEGEEKGRERETEWWVLKPGMSDKGDGVRLFCSEEGLRRIFEGWEADDDEDEEEEEDDDEEDNDDNRNGNLTPSNPQPKPPPTGIITSHLRHFIAQRYIPHPYLFPTLHHRKFHLRSYVLAAGALRVYVFREMLALFAAKPYRAPPETDDEEEDALDMGVHLTNTCLLPDTNNNEEEEEATRRSVIPFWDLPSPTSSSFNKPAILTQITTLTSHLFRAAATTQSLSFQPLPNAFEVFGVDWIVDAEGRVWLLEVNAFPDFGASGSGGRGVVGRFWEGVVGVLVGEGFFGGFKREEGGEVDGVGEGLGGGEGEGENGMIKVLDMDLGRR